ncbi:MAG: TM2 domain-containing protein [Dysgonamonadaceae bacterium]|jgi:TM2 domain-containing membrane protein YozV|nr:TM2 domain-containing protein [Dysgonamonadaceae bacterium]
MDTQKVDMFVMTNTKFFDGFQLHSIKQQLLNLPDEKADRLFFTQFKDPTMSLIISLIGGSLGIDRFFIGDTGLGIGKLLTCGGLGIWTVIDLFLIMSATKEKNLIKLQETLLY